jgi:hypothetical protein
MLADGLSFSVIKQRLQTTAPTIARWKQRFVEAGLEGLDTYHPGQKAVVLTPALRDPGGDAEEIPKNYRFSEGPQIIELMVPGVGIEPTLPLPGKGF